MCGVEGRPWEGHACKVPQGRQYHLHTYFGVVGAGSGLTKASRGMLVDIIFQYLVSARLALTGV